jgi:hypothetical protein
MFESRKLALIAKTCRKENAVHLRDVFDGSTVIPVWITTNWLSYPSDSFLNPQGQ